MSRQKMMTLSMLAALCVLASLAMHAKAAGQQQKQERQDQRDRQEGMVVVRDPQTGKMRAPTPEELRALRAKAPPSAAALSGTPQQNQALTRRDGARGVRLGEKNLVYEVVTRGPDGKLSSQCVKGDAAAEDALHHAANAEHKEHSHEAR
jgi:hypothetical protein